MTAGGPDPETVAEFHWGKRQGLSQTFRQVEIPDGGHQG